VKVQTAEQIGVCSWSLQATGPEDLAEKVNALGVKRVQLGLTPHRGDTGAWNGVEVVLIPKENRKDLREVPRRVLRAMRIVLVDHMDDVLREALVIDDADALFGPRGPIVEYRNGELWEGEAEAIPVAAPPPEGPSEQPTA